MNRLLPEKTRVPALASSLGYAGLIPFVAMAIWLRIPLTVVVVISLISAQLALL